MTEVAPQNMTELGNAAGLCCHTLQHTGRSEYDLNLLCISRGEKREPQGMRLKFKFMFFDKLTSFKNWRSDNLIIQN